MALIQIDVLRKEERGKVTLRGAAEVDALFVPCWSRICTDGGLTAKAEGYFAPKIKFDP